MCLLVDTNTSLTYLLNRRIGAVVGHGAQLKQRRVPGTERDDGRRSVVVHVVPMFHDRGSGTVAGSGSAVTVTVAVAEAVLDSVTGRSTIPARYARGGVWLSRGHVRADDLTCRSPGAGPGKIRRPPSCRGHRRPVTVVWCARSSR